MTNSVAFSSDLKTLFLIEESQVVAFPLATRQGVVIGKVENQIVAATHKPSASSKKFGKIEKYELDSTQLQLHYSARLDKAFLIIIDIDFSKGAEVSNYRTRSVVFDFKKENIILSRIENTLKVIRMSNVKKVVKPNKVEKVK